MKTTERIHWQNGYQKRGTSHHSFAFELLNYGILICFYKLRPSINVFKFI